MKEEIKDKMFQYHDGWKTIEDTGLITAKEADDLWKKHYMQAKDNLKEGQKVQIAIWKDCTTPTDYHTEEKAIDHYDCVVEGGSIYRVKKELVKW